MHKPDHCCLFIASKVQPDRACGYPLSLALLRSSLSVSLQQQKAFFFFSSSALQFSVPFIRWKLPCYSVLNRWRTRGPDQSPLPLETAGCCCTPLRTLKANRNRIKLRLIKAKRGAERGSAGPSRALLWGRDEWPLFSPRPQHLSEGNPDGFVRNDSICVTL